MTGRSGPSPAGSRRLRRRRGPARRESVVGQTRRAASPQGDGVARPRRSIYIGAVAEALISLSEAARIAGVAPSTLQRWARGGVVPVKEGRWTTAAAAQARVVARMRERGHSLEELRRAVRDGRLAFGYVEDLLPGHRERPVRRDEAAARTGLEEELIERVMTLLGTPTALEGTLNEQDVAA